VITVNSPEPSLPPVERSISVSWDPDAAFRRFAAQFADWWPRRTHSIGGPRVRRVVFEQRVGGKIFEEHVDGRRFQWGEVLSWDPPHRVTFTFHPSRDSRTAQNIEMQFRPEGTGTRVVLIATNWENWGRGAKRARRGYGLGWGYVLNVYAGRRTPLMAFVGVLQALVGGLQLLWYRGRARLIDSAGGEMQGA
jgi:uncharacterized protein YndB with AHSA1/START domain